MVASRGGAGASRAFSKAVASASASTPPSSAQSFLGRISALAAAALSSTSTGAPSGSASGSSSGSGSAAPGPSQPGPSIPAPSSSGETAASKRYRNPQPHLPPRHASQDRPPPSKRPFHRKGGAAPSSANPFKHLGIPDEKQRQQQADASARSTKRASPRSHSSRDGSTEQQVSAAAANTAQRQAEPSSAEPEHAEESAPSQTALAEDAEPKTPERVLPRPKQLWKGLENVEGAAMGKLSGLGVSPENVTPLREMKVATLAHGLDRVLFNPGVHWLRDPRTGIYNFPPSLRNILDPDLFDYDALPPYITSSQDKELEIIAKKNEARYCGSTSSMTSLLSQCYFLLSGRKSPDLTGFSEGFKALGGGFTLGASLPASIKLMHKPNQGASGSKDVYAIDADKAASGELDNSNFVLAALGKSMEKMLTVDDAEFRRFERTERWTRMSKGEVDPPTEPEAYHYSKLSKFMMRSQLDCYDPRLPNKTFDLKTRAVVAIRQDRANWVESSGYQIRSNLGLIESFEREYYDMIRAAFLKYGFQARIGNMDGIFVAYHNTKQIFGFQYVPLDEIFTRVFGTVEMGEQAFSLSVRLLEAILDSATKVYPKHSLRLTMFVGEGSDPNMNVFVEPYDENASQTQPTPQPTKEASVSIPNPFGRPIDDALASSGPSSEPLSQRSIVQIDVKVDRFLDGQRIHGAPVDFASVPGRGINNFKEDEIARRLRQNLTPLQWSVDYVIQPRSDLTEAETRRHLSTVRSTQLSVSSLTVPNLEAVAAREAELEERMRQYGGEEAVERWRLERRDGRIGRMPRAPGQKPLNGLEEAEEEMGVGSAEGVDDAVVGPAPGAADDQVKTEESSTMDKDVDAEAVWARLRLPHTPVGPKDLGEGLWTMKAGALRRVRHLRELARLGAQDRDVLEKSDRKEQV
ncbi:hypothetical protein A4X09_0g677 [Tilletia walkeri]|uniref:Pet127-domain-containing protein n=1 Tax=Tilletia walkeri TaxID=117179 RepID=A0A8X7NFP6_9BASI|nr:hypothetical protein A4X09_0g677 [Tilletia walkeri]